jgi:hypothetical protein
MNLNSFLKGSSNPTDKTPGCANYDHLFGGCLMVDTCHVEEGERCSWFEKAVLPTAADTGNLEKITTEYAKRLKKPELSGVIASELGISAKRTCPDCGDVLQDRRRFCDRCKQRRSRAAHRVSYQAKRKNRSTSDS